MDIKDEIELLSSRQKLSPEVLNKPVTTLADNVQARLLTKVDKVPGKELSDNNYVNIDKQKVDRITLSNNINLDDIQIAIDGLTSAVVLKGTWSPASGIFPSGAKPGFSYIASDFGIISGIDFNKNDRLLCIKASPSQSVYVDNWLKLDYTDQVLSVAGKTGEVSLADINLDKVNNTSDIDKPVSTAAQTALNKKTDKTTTVIAGQGLTKGGALSGNVTVDLGLPSDISITSANSLTATSHTHKLVLSKADIELGNVDNTTDVNKPVSSATQTTLNTKADKTITIKGSGALVGGGALSASSTIDASGATKASLALADTAIQASDLGSAAYEGKYLAGTNIAISGTNTISAIDTKYTAGAGVTLTGTEFTLHVAGTGTGTFVQSVTQSANGITVNKATPPDTKYLAGNGITLSGTTFTVPVSTEGSGAFVQSVTQVPGGVKVVQGTPPDTKYTAGGGLTLSGTEFTLPIEVFGAGTHISNVEQTVNGVKITTSTPVDTLFSAGTGLTLSGTSFSVKYGTTAGTAAQGNDSRIVNAATKTELTTGISTKVDKVLGKALSDENFTLIEKNKLSGIEIGSTKNETDEQLRDRTTHTGFQPIATVTGLQAGLDSKVDKVTGKALSDENFTLIEKNKLSGIDTGATKNSTDAQLRDRTTHTGVQAIATVTGLQVGLDSKVDKVTGKALSDENYTLIEKNKLSGIENNATKNATDAQLRARSTHTGTQAISTIVSLKSELDSKIDKVLGKDLSDENYTAVEKLKLSGIATGATKNATDTQLRARATHTGEQAIATVTGLQVELDSKVDKVLGKQLSDENFALADKNKLTGIAVGATKNSTDAQLRDRTTHTGVQPIATVTGLQTGLDSKVDKVAGKVLSDQNYTLIEKNKLAGLESSKWRGLFSTIAGLPTTGQGGDYADVDAGVGQDVQRFIWDVSDKKWIAQSGTVSSLTGAQIKQLYEAQPNSNAYTDADKTKLSGIATGATKNSTDTQLRDRTTHTGVQAITTVTGLQAGLDSKVDKVVGQGLSDENYTLIEKNQLSGIVVGATKNATDTQLRDRTTHTGVQAIATVTGLQAGLDAKVDVATGKSLILDTEITRLTRIETGATKNSTDAQLRARSTHTGTQPVATITGLGNAVTHNYGTLVNTIAQGNDTRINNGQTAFSWGNHASAGYIKSFTNTTYTASTGLTLTGTVFSVNYGTAAGTAAQGNDARINNGQTAFSWGNHASAGYIKSFTNTTYTAGSGLTLTGTVFSANYGTAAGTAAQGNDARINNGQTAFTRLNIGTTAVTARTALQLGDAVTHNYGTAANTIMMGNDASVVRVTSNQNIAGVKTHTDKVIMVAGTEYVKAGKGFGVVYNDETESLDFNWIGE